jgi:hypothetical protein
VADRDAYRASRDQTEGLERELRDIRRDVEAIVTQEVRRATDPARVEGIVRDAVRRELSARTPWLVLHAGWVGPLVGVLLGLSLGLGVFAVVLARRDRAIPAADTTVATLDAPALPAASASPETTAPAADPAQLAARYDSLFGAADGAFHPLLGAVDSATTNAVVQRAVAAWGQRALTQAERDRLHGALVQLALRDLVEPALVVDGEILRDPCRGTTCGALLRVWRDRGRELALPPYHAGAAADGAAVRQAERVLVMTRVASGR